MKVLSFGITAAAVIILFVLPFTTSIHSPSSCSLLFSCPPHRQSSLTSFLSSFESLGLCFGHLSSFPFSNLLAFKKMKSHLFAHGIVSITYCLFVPHALICQKSLRVLRFSVLLIIFECCHHFHCFLFEFALFFAQ